MEVGEWAMRGGGREGRCRRVSSLGVEERARRRRGWWVRKVKVEGSEGRWRKVNVSNACFKREQQ